MDATDRENQISLVIPAYNEVAVIAQAVREAESALYGQFETFEILIVDDGSLDHTARIVEDLLPLAPHTRLIRHDINKGYGAALRTGFETARYDVIAFTDADCQFDLSELVALARIARIYPIVAGYRVDRKDTWKRRFFSWGYNRLARSLLGSRVRDVDCALKVFRREALAQLLPESEGFFVNTEMMTRAGQFGFRIAEHPVSHRPRASGVSKVSLREIPRTASRLLRYWWSNVVLGAKPVSATPVVFESRVSMPGGVSARIQLPEISPSLDRPVVLPAQQREVA